MTKKKEMKKIDSCILQSKKNVQVECTKWGRKKITTNNLRNNVKADYFIASNYINKIHITYICIIYIHVYKCVIRR